MVAHAVHHLPCTAHARHGILACHCDAAGPAGAAPVINHGQQAPARWGADGGVMAVAVHELYIYLLLLLHTVERECTGMHAHCTQA